MTQIRPRPWIGGLTVFLLAACGSPPAPPVAPEPEPVEEEEEQVVEEPDPGILSRALIEARVREPFGVESAGRLPSRPPRRALVVLDPPAEPVRTADSRDTALGPASDAEGGAEEEAEAGAEAEAAAEREGDLRVVSPRPGAPTSPSGPPSATAPPRSTPTAQPSSPARSPGQRTHTVQSGETFYAIARRYDVTPMALAAANPGVDIHRIRSGQVLRLPQSGSASASATPPAARTHRVQAGETLWSISRRYGLSPAQIRQANRMTDDTVRIGETLVIP